MENLAGFGIIPVDYAALQNAFPALKAFKDKVGDLESKGSLIRLKRGMYIVSPAVSGKEVSVELIANHIYGPSYVSMESALRYYRLIPERVYNTTSMTIKRGRTITNPFGEFKYIFCPSDYYSIGIIQIIQDKVAFLIASPEKALCDLIAYTPNLRIRSVKSLKAFLEEDIRFDMDVFHKMNVSVFEHCAEVSKKKTEINMIIKLLKS